MFRRSTGAFALVVAVLTTGCGSLTGTRTGNLYDRNDVDVIADAPEARFAWVKPSRSDERFCLAPDPDTALSATVSSDVDLHLPTKGAIDDKFTASESVQGLSGRTSSVVMLRELMYRACEMSSNISANAEDTRAIYSQFIQAAIRMIGQPSGLVSPVSNVAGTVSPAK